MRGLLRADASKTWAFFIELIVSETNLRNSRSVYAPFPEHSANSQQSILITIRRS